MSLEDKYLTVRDKHLELKKNYNKKETELRLYVCFLSDWPKFDYRLIKATS